MGLGEKPYLLPRCMPRSRLNSIGIAINNSKYITNMHGKHMLKHEFRNMAMCFACGIAGMWWLWMEFISPVFLLALLLCGSISMKKSKISWPFQSLGVNWDLFWCTIISFYWTLISSSPKVLSTVQRAEASKQKAGFVETSWSSSNSFEKVFLQQICET